MGLRKKILFILETSCIGGIEQQALTILKHLDKKKYQVHVIITDIDWLLGTEFKKHSYKYTTLDMLNGSWNEVGTPSAQKLNIIKEYIIKNKIRVVHLFNGIQYVFGVPIEVPLVISLCGDFSRGVYFSRVNAQGDPRAAVNENLSQRKKLTIISDTPTNRCMFGHQMIIMRNCIELAEVKDVKRENKTVIWVGRNSPEKRPEEVIKMAKILPKHKFIMVISDFQSPIPEEWNSIRNISIYRNVIDREYLLKLYRSSDVFLLTSTTEGYPLTLPEAMKQGCFPVASQVGNINKNTLPYGVLIKYPEQTRAYSRGIKEWDAEKDKDSIRAELQDYAEKYDIKNTLNHLQNIYLEAIDGVVKSNNICIRGSSVHTLQMANQISADIIGTTTTEMPRYDTIIHAGVFNFKYVDDMFRFAIDNPDKKYIIWWVGTDVYNLKRGRYTTEQVEILKNPVFSHLCVSAGLRLELESMGIEAELVTLTPHMANYDIGPLPRKYAVAVYMPSDNLDFYKYALVKQIIRKTPRINYIVYGNKVPLDIEKYKNVECRGWVEDTKDIFKDSSCLLRLTKHDGFPKSIIKAACLKRYVIINHRYPKLKCLKTVKDIVKHLKTKPKLRRSTQMYYQDTYNDAHIKRYFKATIRMMPYVGENNGIATHIETLMKYSRYNIVHSQTDGATGQVSVTHAGGLPLEHLEATAEIDAYTAHSYYVEEDYAGELKNVRQSNTIIIENAKKANRVICVSDYMRQFLIGNGIPNSKLVTLRNPVDIEYLDTVPEYNGKLPKDFSLFIGDRFVKRPELLIKLAKNFPEDNFMFIGNNKDDSELPDNITSIDRVSRDMLLGIMKRSKLFVLLSKRESCPYVLLEAMAMRKICIASNYAGQKEIITPYYDGYLFEPDKLGSLVQNYELARREGPEMGKNARGTIERRFDVRIQAPKFDGAYIPPQVSVVTFVYCSETNNRWGLLQEAINSVKDQGFPSYEHIIVDDGSTIDLKTKILELKDNRLKYFWKPHTGILHNTETFNYGLRKAMGQYIIYLASDDMQTTGALSVLSKYLDEHPDQIGVVGGVQNLYQDGRMTEYKRKIAPFFVGYCNKCEMPRGIYEKDEEDSSPHQCWKCEEVLTDTKSESIKDMLLIGNCVHGCAIMFRHGALMHMEEVPNEAGMCCDYDLWLKLSEVGEIARTPDIVAVYRRHDDSTYNVTHKDMDYRQKCIDLVVNNAKERRGLL